MRITVLAVAAAMAALAGTAVAQEPAARPDRAAVIKAAREVAEAARFCTFVTLGEDGQPQARIIDVFPLEADLTAWIGTRSDTRKVGQLRRDSRATLLCFDAPSLAYVTLLGTAELVTDPADKARHWKSEWKGYYADENRGPDYVLIRLRPARVEVLSPGHGLYMGGGGMGPAILKLQ